MSRTASAVLALALVVTSVAGAENKPAAAKVREQERLALTQGPIKISAAHAELAEREVAVYSGNVRLTSSDLTLTGDRLELRQPARGQFEAHLTGRPAHLLHAAVGDAPPMAASAADIVYDTKSAQVDLTGAVQLDRGTDTLTSDSLHYDVAARRITASGGSGQVQITIQPPPGTLPEPKSAPVPQNTAQHPPKKRKGPKK